MDDGPASGVSECKFIWHVEKQMQIPLNGMEPTPFDKQKY